MGKLLLREEEILYLLDSGNEKDLIEKAARERLGYYYPDEVSYQDISGK
jgi:cell division protein FtsB